MKKYLTLIICSLILILGALPVNAASFSMRASSTQVSPNGTFTISVGGDCIGRVNLSVNNGTLSTSSVWVEQSYQTVTVTAGGSGTVTVTATPTAGFSDPDANEYNPGARSVTVSIIDNTSVPNNNNNNNNNSKPYSKPQTPTYVDNRSTNNMLSSITVSSGTLSPAFDTNISEYTVQLASNTTSITVNAESSDSKARINGIGEKQLEVGNNEIIISVVAENGAERIYKIIAYVDETPQVYLKYKDKEIGVVRNLKGITIPEGFNQAQHPINDYSIDIFNNGNFSILYGINDQNEKSFYIIDTTKNECISKIVPIKINNNSLYLVDLDDEKEGFEKGVTTVNNVEIQGYKFKDGFDNYFLLSVMNNNGEMVEYIYEANERTLQLYSNFAPITYEKYKTLAQVTDEQYKELTQKLKIEQIIICIVSILLILSIISSVVLFIKLKRGKINEKKN
jgi:hypothetical protein